jgi:hypothetical protein
MEENFVCAAIDLSGIGIGTDNFDIEAWYLAVIRELVEQINLNEFDLRIWWNHNSSLSLTKRLNKFIEEQLLSSVPPKNCHFCR